MLAEQSELIQSRRFPSHVSLLSLWRLFLLVFPASGAVFIQYLFRVYLPVLLFSIFVAWFYSFHFRRIGHGCTKVLELISEDFQFTPFGFARPIFWLYQKRWCSGVSTLSCGLWLALSTGWGNRKAILLWFYRIPRSPRPRRIVQILYDPLQFGWPLTPWLDGRLIHEVFSRLHHFSVNHDCVSSSKSYSALVAASL